MMKASHLSTAICAVLYNPIKAVISLKDAKLQCPTTLQNQYNLRNAMA